MLANRRLDVGSFVSHRYELDEIQEAYDVFSGPGEWGPSKVALFGRRSSVRGLDRRR